jgi:ribA/ribD-fused uncharacterized protein
MAAPGGPERTITITKVRLPYGWMSNMSPHPVEHEGVRYRTSEALFQCLRFQGHPEVQQEIRAQPSPMGAKMIARKNRQLLNRSEPWDEDEDDIDRMRLCLKLKLAQHPDLQQALLATGDALIIEDCSKRDRESARFWGAVWENGAWVGRNVLGTLWIELREELRQGRSPGSPG